MTLKDRYLQNFALLIDPQWISRSGLKHLLQEQTSYQHVLEAGDIEAAHKKLSEFPNIKLIIMELRLPAMNCAEAIAAVEAKAGSIPILAISDGATRQEILDAVVYGASGFVCKSGSEEEILEAITAVESGAIHISGPMFCKTNVTMSNLPPVAHSQHHAYDPMQASAVADLTERQREILHELGQGQSNRMIADDMGISVNTVKIHVGAILRALDVKNRTQAALLVQSFEMEHDNHNRVGNVT